ATRTPSSNPTRGRNTPDGILASPRVPRTTPRRDTRSSSATSAVCTAWASSPVYTGRQSGGTKTSSSPPSTSCTASIAGKADRQTWQAASNRGGPARPAPKSPRLRGSRLARYAPPQGRRAGRLALAGRPPFRRLHQSRLHQFQPVEKPRHGGAVAEGDLLRHHLVEAVGHLGHHFAV